MIIEIGKSYRVEPKFKKSVVECEYFNHPDLPGSVEVATCWRYGEYVIVPADEDEVVMLHEGILSEEEFEVSAFSEWELLSTYDGCSEDIYFHGTEMDSDEEEEFIEKHGELGFEFLDDAGWQSSGCEVYINNGINVEEWKGYGNE